MASFAEALLKADEVVPIVQKHLSIKKTKEEEKEHRLAVKERNLKKLVGNCKLDDFDFREEEQLQKMALEAINIFEQEKVAQGETDEEEKLEPNKLVYERTEWKNLDE